MALNQSFIEDQLFIRTENTPKFFSCVRDYDASMHFYVSVNISSASEPVCQYVPDCVYFPVLSVLR